MIGHVIGIPYPDFFIDSVYWLTVHGVHDDGRTRKEVVLERDQNSMRWHVLVILRRRRVLAGGRSRDAASPRLARLGSR